jgi:hypothetical protein
MDSSSKGFRLFAFREPLFYVELMPFKLIRRAAPKNSQIEGAFFTPLLISSSLEEAPATTYSKSL